MSVSYAHYQEAGGRQFFLVFTTGLSLSVKIPFEDRHPNPYASMSQNPRTVVCCLWLCDQRTSRIAQNIECKVVEGPGNRAGWTVEVEGRRTVL